jgi:hypothetical protein
MVERMENPSGGHTGAAEIVHSPSPKSLAALKAAVAAKQFKVSPEARRKAALVVSSLRTLKDAVPDSNLVSAAAPESS